MSRSTIQYMHKVKNMEYRLRRKPPNTKSLKGIILQLLGIQRAYVFSPASVGVHKEEGILMDVSPDYSHSRQIETALLKAESMKAKALMEMEKQHMRRF